MVDAKLDAGFYSALWDGRDDAGELAGSGVYLYRMEVGEFSKTRRMVLIR